MFKANFQVQVKLRSLYVADRSAQWDSLKAELCGTPEAMQSLMYGNPDIYSEVRWWTRWRFFPMQPGGLLGFTPKHGHSGVYVPGKPLPCYRREEGVITHRSTWKTHDRETCPVLRLW